MQDKFDCFLVRKSEDDSTSKVVRGIEELSLNDLPDGDVVIRTRFSSLNYKDALAATGHPGVVKQFPHIPGVDAAGEVVSSSDPFFNVGDSVMVFHAKFGTASFGGHSEMIRVPKEWVYHLPNGVSMHESMIYGTAGFTAAQSVDALVMNEVRPSDGEVLVTGATGGVGSMAVRILAKLGYSVVAVSGKSDKVEWLKSLGAAEIMGRDRVVDESERPLLKARWAGAIDTVGGSMLSSVLRATKEGGCVTACGLVAGHELSLTVYPFILRGVTLQGIDSANINYETRKRIWDKLANEYALANLEEMSESVRLDNLEPKIVDILAGKVSGRVVVELGNDTQS